MIRIFLKLSLIGWLTIGHVSLSQAGIIETFYIYDTTPGSPDRILNDGGNGLFGAYDTDDISYNRGGYEAEVEAVLYDFSVGEVEVEQTRTLTLVDYDRDDVFDYFEYASIAWDAGLFGPNNSRLDFAFDQWTFYEDVDGDATNSGTYTLDPAKAIGEVPLPASIWLFFSALGCLGFFKRRQLS